MKKRAILSLVFAALAFASCAVKGGTIEVTNGHSSYNASIAVYKDLVQVTSFETVAPGNKVTFSFDEDGTYTVNAIFISGSSTKDYGAKEVVLSGGETKSVKVTPSK